MGKQRNLFECSNYMWDGVDMIDYKPDDNSSVTFFNVTRQNILASMDGINFDMRYFECGPGGYTTLEIHEHAHVVMTLRGRGKVIIQDEVIDVKPYDMFVIPSKAAHQLVNAGDDPFGFVCTVNAMRDKFKLLSKVQMDELQKIDEVRKTMRVPKGYFGDEE